MRYGIAPKELNFIRRLFFPRIQRPPYLRRRREDDLNTLLSSQKWIIQEGVVVLGALIQANNLLFKPGRNDNPGDLLLSLDPAIDPETLLAAARDLFSLKGKKWPDPERAKIAHHLTNEMTRAVGLPVPPEISRGFQCFCTTTIFRRKSLPSGKLDGKLIPTLVHPRFFLAMPLPHEY